MPLQFPTTITPGEALETIAQWSGVTPDELQKQIDAKAPANSTSEEARIQFIFGYIWRLWEDWYQLELNYLQHSASEL